MSGTSEEDTTDSGFNSVINRVLNALDSARRELASRRNTDNLLTATRTTFRRRRRAGPMAVTSANSTLGIWRVRLFLLPNADQAVLPSYTECCRLSTVGLGSPSPDSQGSSTQGSITQLSWTLSEFNNFICQSFPSVSLNLIGFQLARADKSRVLSRLQANTLKELKTALGRSRLYIIPQANITLPIQISEAESTASTSSSTTLMARPVASPTAFPAILEGPSTSAITPPASLAVPQVTQPAPTAPTLDTEGSSSPEASVDSAQWLNAGTPEVFYRRERMASLISTPIEDFLMDDSEDGEEDEGSLTLPFRGDGPPLEEVDLATLLKKFQVDHLYDELGSTIPIRRKKILEGAMKAISRVSFSWTHSPHIEFIGEEADDMGGPQREFFRLLMIEVQTSLGIFEGKAGQVFLSYDQAALDQGKFYKAGQLVAWSVAHRGPCLKALDPSLFLLMCGQDPQLDQFDWHVLPDPEVQTKVERIQQCKTAGDLTALQQELGDWIADCGVPGIFSTTCEEIPRIYAYVVKHYIFLRTAKMVTQFTDGLNAFGGLWDIIKANWIAFLPLFTNMQEPLSKEAFRAIFLYTYSSRGSNAREAEEDTIYCWEMVLNMIEDKESELKYEEILIFVTGADEVPALGFINKPSIDFFQQEAGQRRLPYASTCMMCLYLPRGITQEEELHKMLFQAIRDSVGFGKV